MQLIILRIFTVLLFIVCHQVNADRLENLPTQWQQQLTAVAPIDESTFKPGVWETIEVARTKVDALLQLEKPDKKRLAAAYGNLGNLYLTHGLYTSADASYSNAIKLTPEHFPWRYYAAYLSQENGNMQAALSRFKKASELDPEYLPAQYRLAQVYLDLNKLDAAYNLFKTLMSDSELEAAAHYGLGQVLLIKQDYANAAEHLTRALELAPEATSIHYPLALSLRSVGKADQAKQHLKQYKKHEIVIKDPLVESLEALKDPAYRHFVEAMTAVIRKDFNKAIKEFEAGLAYEPDNTAARTSYSRALYIIGIKDKARNQLEGIIKKQPDKTIALFLLAILNDESGNSEKAAELYRRVIDLNATHEGANFFLGNYYLRHKDYNKAIRHYETVTLKNDKNIPAHIFKLVAMMSNEASDKELLAITQQITDRSPNTLSVRRIQILLLALSKEADVRNSDLALTLAEKMYESSQYPANLELLALSTASAGNYKLGSEQMRKALAAEKQHKNSRSITRMNNNLLQLQEGRLPELNWHEEIRHMQPPPTNALATFRDYPDANPI
jgi:tetratricopeptide (TPR) repeat protein